MVEPRLTSPRASGERSEFALRIPGEVPPSPHRSMLLTRNPQRGFRPLLATRRGYLLLRARELDEVRPRGVDMGVHRGDRLGGIALHDGVHHPGVLVPGLPAAVRLVGRLVPGRALVMELEILLELLVVGDRGDD